MKINIMLPLMVIVAGGCGFYYYTTCKTEITHKQLHVAKDTSMKSTESGILYEILTESPEGAVKPQPGQTVTVHYTGWINENGQPGQKFDSSVDRGDKFQFMVGIGQVIRGWDESVLDMKVGEKRRVIIPSELAYGSRGAGTVIAPHSDLMFDIELFEAQ
ncbi:FKBP-type peptidyl-prolyl cis-trans isomerase [Candidatus Babeliales bacterium]|nr:FKBP-type peptidyl-prolyl cis-trans isomerase [Candidatus Babeliales bacterium]